MKAVGWICVIGLLIIGAYPIAFGIVAIPGNWGQAYFGLWLGAVYYRSAYRIWQESIAAPQPD